MTLVSVEVGDRVEISASMPSAFASDDRLSELLSELRTSLACPVQNFNLTAAPTRTALLHQLISEQAGRTPHAVAIRAPQGDLTYAELEQHAEELSHDLETWLGESHEPVALLMEHSVESIVAILAVLKSGRPFLPLDPKIPVEYWKFIVTGAKSKLLLTNIELDRGGFDLHVAICDLRKERCATAQAKQRRLVSADTLAYVIYTSGSTGRPKGVAVSHRSIVNYVCFAAAEYLNSLEEPPIFALFTSPAFDLTLTTLFVPLASGGSVEILHEKEPLQALHEVARDSKANVLKLTPTHLRILSELDLSHTKIRVLIVGGEPLPTHLANSVRASLGGLVDIFNEYGPTEATVGCMFHLFSPTKDMRATVPIGRPIANAHIYLMNSEFEEVGIGQPGEIFIGGVSVASYLSADEGERFLMYKDERLYRTGDLAVWDTDDQLYFLGRRDEQVKVRGFRLEPVEIEGVILASGKAAACAVLLTKDAEERSAIVAFVESHEDDVEAKLQSYLREHLPGYMIPHRIVTVSEISQTANGKVDKDALLAQIERAAPADGYNGNLELTDQEMKVIAIVAEVLGCSTRDVHPSKTLWEIGCDSLGLATILTRLCEQLLTKEEGSRLWSELGGIIQTPTVERLCVAVTSIQKQRPGEH